MSVMDPPSLCFLSLHVHRTPTHWVVLVVPNGSQDMQKAQPSQTFLLDGFCVSVSSGRGGVVLLVQPSPHLGMLQDHFPHIHVQNWRNVPIDLWAQEDARRKMMV